MIDFKLIESPEDFELFCEELLKTYGFTILSRPARGQGQGKDIVCQRHFYDEFVGNHIQKFLVECKHFAVSGKSVLETDIKEFFSRTIRNECNHYLLITSTIASVTIRDHIEATNNDKSLPITAHIWNKGDLVKRVYKKPEVWEYYTGQKISTPKPLSCFHRIDDIFNTGSHYTPDKNGFKNNLFYISEEDKKNIEKIRQIYQSYDTNNRIVILEGPPASGKTVFSFILAKKLEEDGYTTFVHRVTSNSSIDTIWSDLVNNDLPNTLFVFENCHLNTEISNYIYANILSVKNLNCLFVTRPISEKIRFALELDNLDVFTTLSEFTFNLCVENNENEKSGGIIKRHQKYYELQYSREFLIGDISKILKNIRGNLLALYFYLESWPAVNSLDETDTEDIYKELYKRYLLHPTSDILLKYAALYQFEINIEPNENESLPADILLRQGVLLFDFEKESYYFYHSDFSKLLVESYQFRPSFSRKYKNLDDFGYQQIKSYFLGFSKYPSNIHEVVRNLIAKNKNTILKRLLSDPFTREKIFSFYRAHENLHIISELLSFVFITDKSQISAYANELVLNDNAKELFHKTNILYYANIFQILFKTDKAIYHSFLEKFSDDDLSNIVLSSPLSGVNSAISLLNGDQKLKSKIESFLNYKYISQESEKNSFRSLSISLAFLSRSNSNLVYEVLKSIPSKDLAKKAENEFLGDIATGLVTFQNINHTQAREIYLNIPDEVIIAKAENIGCTFIGMTNGLFNLCKIDFPKTRSIAKRISFQSILEKANDSSNGFMKIIDGLTFLHRFSRSKFDLLISQINLTKLFQKSLEENVFTTFQRLNQLNKINVQVARSLVKNIDIKPIVTTLENDQISINSFSKLLADLNNVHMEKSWSILENIKTETLYNKLKEDNITVNELGQAVSIFKKVHPRKAHDVLELFTAQELVHKSENSKFTGITLGLTSLYKIDGDKIRFCLRELGSSFFKKKAEKSYLSFGAVVKGLSFLRGINHEFSAEVYNLIDEDIIAEKLRKARMNKHIIKQKELLLSLNKERTIRIFKKN